MENPIRNLRRQLGLGRAEFAAYLGLTYSQLNNAENGYISAMPLAWRGAFEAKGLNFDAIARDYRAHLDSRAAQVTLKLETAGGAA